MMRTVFSALAICAAVACGGTSDGFDDEHATLVIEPATSEHMIVVGGAPPTQPYTAILTSPNGATKDVTAETQFFIESGFGSFEASTLQIYSPGKATVSALYADKQGTATVIARVKSQRVADDPANPNDDVPPNAPDLFAGAEDPATAPTIVYPADGVTMPRNLGDFEAHWTDAHGHDVFELSIKSEFADIRVYLAGNNGLAQAGPRPSWAAFTPDEWRFAVATDNTVQYQVRGVTAADPTSVGAAAPRVVKLTNEAMEGGVYYWAASAAGGGAYGIFRHDVATPGQPAEEFMTNVSTGKCVACHALSRDGKTMAITYDGGNGRATIVDVATRTAQPVPDPAIINGQPDYSTDASRWNFATLYPDGSRMISVFNGVITVRATADQSALIDMPAAGYSTHPDLSPDMTRLVYIRATGGGSDWGFTGGQVFTRTFDPITLAFGPETPLVETTDNFYPSWSPDGQWVLFNRAAGSSYNNVNATLWVVKADASAPPIQLAAFNAAAGGLTNSWGRWAPFAQTVGSTAEPMYWVTVSSKRDFGVRRLNSLDAEAAKTPQIWMSPFFTARAAAGTDPTGPAFRLPFQNLTSNNHIAQWTERVIVAQ